MSIDIRSLTRRALVAVAVLAGAACGGGGSTGPGDSPPVQAATVDATPQIQFNPGRVRLVRGGTVTFRFGTVAHNVYFDGSPAGAPANITGARSAESVTVTFDAAGTFGYECHIHPGMTGTVVVQ